MKIFKYPVEITDELTIEMPKNADIMHFGIHNHVAALWACVDPENPMVERKFKVVGTGHEMPTNDNLNYIGTITNHELQYVWHLFEVI